MYPLIGSLAQLWQKRNYLQLTDEEAETQLGPLVHKSQNLRAIKHQNCILDQELLNLSCCLFFTVHKLTIVFRFQSGYVRKYTASQSIKPKVVSIWLFTGKKKKKSAIPALDHCHHQFLKTYSPEKLWITGFILLFHMQERNLCIINPKYIIFYFKSYVALPFKLRPLFKVNLLILSTPYRINNNNLKQNILKLRKPKRKRKS